ncbi:hypothetical protein ACVNIS_06380 [Sphaerotilaceae bacterium SBD11-9]
MFSAPAPKKHGNHPKGHADFGPSILATIDGGQARIAGARDRSAVKRVMVMAVLAFVAAAVYLGMKFSGARVTSAPHPTPVAAAEPSAEQRPIDATPPLASQIAVQGVAAIETVPPATETALPPASVPPIKEDVGFNAIQQTLAQPDSAPPKKEERAASQKAKPTRTTATTQRHARPAGQSAKQSDTDAELLAAMLPHLRSTPAPSSPAFERRCGQLTGDALASCRVRFCNGRQGEDSACPAAADSGR